MTTDPEVDVVILTWNDGELLHRALKSVEESSGVRLHVYVVDNGSVPPAEVAPGRVPITLLRNRDNIGVAAGRNLGIRAGTADIVCILDSDASVGSHSIVSLADVLLRRPEVGLVGPVFRDQAPDDSGGKAPGVWRKAIRVIAGKSYAGTQQWHDDLREVDFVIGAMQVFRRRAFDDVGGLDSRIFYGPEDVDFCLRLRDQGWSVVQLRGLDVIHPPRRRNRRLLHRTGRDHALAFAKFIVRRRLSQARRILRTGQSGRRRARASDR